MSQLLCTLVAYIANILDPDDIVPLEAVWPGFRVYASMMNEVGEHLNDMNQT